MGETPVFNFAMRIISGGSDQDFTPQWNDPDQQVPENSRHQAIFLIINGITNPC